MTSNKFFLYNIVIDDTITYNRNMFINNFKYVFIPRIHEIFYLILKF